MRYILREFLRPPDPQKVRRDELCIAESAERRCVGCFSILRVNLEIDHRALELHSFWAKLLHTYLGEQKYERWVRYLGKCTLYCAWESNIAASCGHIASGLSSLVV